MSNQTQAADNTRNDIEIAEQIQEVVQEAECEIYRSAAMWDQQAQSHVDSMLLDLITQRIPNKPK